MRGNAPPKQGCGGEGACPTAKPAVDTMANVFGPWRELVVVAIDRPLRLVHPTVVEFGRARASAAGALAL
jgi:hypothetical protein